MKTKLRKQLAHKYTETKQYKPVIVNPEEAVYELGWKSGQQFELMARNGKLVIKPKTKNTPTERNN